MQRKSEIRLYELHQYMGLHTMVDVTYSAHPCPGATVLGRFSYCTGCGMVTREGGSNHTDVPVIDADLEKVLPETIRATSVRLQIYRRKKFHEYLQQEQERMKHERSL